ALHDLLALVCGFPSFYGRIWDAFWDAITGLVQMPHVVMIWDWDLLATRLPRSALSLLESLTSAREQYPETAAELRLHAEGDAVIDVAAEFRRLEAIAKLS
ncbi:MAG: barstar family protein, partial [Myxococcales bacterium]|nr:barstar family protein [Myxococcales bacterium]